MNDPDPHNLLLGHIGHLKVPQWVTDSCIHDSDKSGYCSHCHLRFLPLLSIGRSAKHHCRLCGENVCRSCTSKLKIPSMFEKKTHKEINANGSVLARVCHQCLFLVLVRRVRGGETSHPVISRVTSFVTGLIEGNTNPSVLLTQADEIKLQPKTFYKPDTWANIHDTATCFKCNVHTDRRHSQTYNKTTIGKGEGEQESTI